MKPNKPSPAEDLRRRAEARLQSHASPTGAEASAADIQRLLHELQVHQIELEMQNEELLRIGAELEKSRDRYLELFDFSPVAYLTLTEQGKISEANLAAAELLGVDRRQLTTRRFAHYVLPENADRWHLQSAQALQCRQKVVFELALKRADGATFTALLECLAITAECASTTLNIAIINITTQKVAENILQHACRCLEDKVIQSQNDLEKSRAELEEVNTALKVMLKHQESEKSHEQQQLLIQVNEIVMPFLERLKHSSVTVNQISLLRTLEANLRLVLASYRQADSFSAACHQLTPVEVHVATMIREGLSSKAIAAALHISPETVGVHRKHIRKKLGLTDVTSHLGSYLLNLKNKV